MWLFQNTHTLILDASEYVKLSSFLCSQYLLHFPIGNLNIIQKFTLAMFSLNI